MSLFLQIKQTLQRQRNRVIRVVQSPDFIFSAVVVIIWRILLEIYAVFSLHRFPFSDVVSRDLYLLKIWNHYDGGHYTSIAQQGYEYIQYAFFPLYPLAIKAVATVPILFFGERLSIYILAGLVVTTMSLVGAIYFLLRISRQLFDSDTGKRAVFLMLFFPSAIFLGAVYTESFFLLWVTGGFYFAMNRQWRWAALFGAAAALTRLVGLVMVACLVVEFLVMYRHTWRAHLRELLWLFFIPLAFISYLIYQWIVMGNPLHFLAAQSAWGREIDTSVVQSIVNEMKRGLNLANFGAEMIAPMYDALAVVFGVVMSLALAYRRLWSFAIFTLAVTVISLASGITVGAIRYVIVAFPAFILLGYCGRNQIFYSFVLAGFAIFFALLSIHYLNGWWLAQLFLALA